LFQLRWIALEQAHRMVQKRKIKQATFVKRPA